MKKILSIALLTFAVNSFANPVDVKPSSDKIRPSEVEQVITVQTATTARPNIAVVKVDNGGSSDIGAFMTPSRVYLAIHMDGEMFDVDGNYLVLPGVVTITSAKLDNASKTVIIEGTSRNDELKTSKFSVKVLIKNALSEIKTATSNATEYTLRSTVGVQNLNP